MRVEIGLAVAIDTWMLSRVARDVAVGQWPDATGFIGLNVGIDAFADRQYLEALRLALDEAPALRERLVLELTDTDVASDPHTAALFTTEVRATGAQIAVDRFGLSGTSLQHLASMAPDYVKLAPELMSAASHDARQHRVLRALVEACDALDIRVIAAHLDNDTLLAATDGLALYGVQGFALARPTVAIGA